MNLDYLRSLQWLRSGVEIARLTAFLIFIALGLRILWLERRAQPTHRAVVKFVVWALIVSCGVGVTQIEAWPFTTWALVHNISPTRMIDWPVYGVAADGRLYRLDYRFVHPMPYEDFDTWMKYYLLRSGRNPSSMPEVVTNPGLTTPEQRRIAEFIVARADAARVRFLQTGEVSTNGRYLGRLAAPYHFDRPPLWRTIADVPQSPFVGLQIWQEEWGVDDRLRDESRVTRTLIFDYRS